ncbi:F-box protein [Pyrus ussuriensis x Pyrus communis]|uniref:F-box protein n=1 Tax=Pyrus ussuriensis x Pyrus communis TaxID=2448454 RepID=A0A5N5FE54_9ROSA|nr:F-box protein [Pyrus ussuriensis x Pyrus communis]
MNHRKRVATTPLIGGEARLGEKWPQPEVFLCKFHQLPQALVMEIFSRPNFKTLSNCRFVCKPWLSLITDPLCSHLCLWRSPTPGILIKTTPPETKSRKLDYTWIEEHADSHWGIEKMRFSLKNSLPISDFKVINSCNGLPCLSGPGKYGPFAVTNEYKVLQTFYPECESSSPDNLYETEISTIGTGVWRSIENAPWDYVCLSFNVLLHGALHWVSESTRYSEFIRSFSFEREQFKYYLHLAASQNGRRNLQIV